MLGAEWVKRGMLGREVTIEPCGLCSGSVDDKFYLHMAIHMIINEKRVPVHNECRRLMIDPPREAESTWFDPDPSDEDEA